MRVSKALHEPKRVEVGVRELRAHLSRWLDAVQRGREIVVTDRGKPVARLTRVRRPEDLDSEDPLAKLIAAGLVRPARKPKTEIRPVKAKGSVTELLLQQRESDRLP